MIEQKNKGRGIRGKELNQKMMGKNSDLNWLGIKGDHNPSNLCNPLLIQKKIWILGKHILFSNSGSWTSIVLIWVYKITSRI